MSNSINTALGFSGNYYHGNVRYTRNLSLALARIFALLASLLVLAQMIYTILHKEAFCLDEGCKVVESLSKVSPMVFNLTGFFFFLLIFWGLGRVRRRPYRVPPLISVLLLAALASEAVLVAFQLQIVQTLCLYCLCVFACVVVLNLLLGIRQTMQGLVLFLAVFLSFSSLNYSTAASSNPKLNFTDGSFAVRMGSNQEEEHYLFLSSTCTHCKEVSDHLEIMLTPTVFFNPIDEMKALNLAGVEQRANWSPGVNQEVLRVLGIDTVPVLISMSKKGQEMTISRGGKAILSRLGQQSVTAAPENSGQSDQNQNTDSCSVGSDCDEGFLAPTPLVQPAL